MTGDEPQKMMRSPDHPLRNLARTALWRWRYPALEVRNKVRFGLTAVTMRRIEDAEVARLEAEMHESPSAMWRLSSRPTVVPNSWLRPCARRSRRPFEITSSL